MSRRNAPHLTSCLIFLFISMLGCGSSPQTSIPQDTRAIEIEKAQKLSRETKAKAEQRQKRESKLLQDACHRKTASLFTKLPDSKNKYPWALNQYLLKQQGLLELPTLPFAKNQQKDVDYVVLLERTGRTRFFRPKTAQPGNDHFVGHSKRIMATLTKKRGPEASVLVVASQNTSYKHLLKLRKKLPSRISLSIVGQLTAKGQLSLHQQNVPLSPRSLTLALASALEVTGFNRLAASNIVVDRQDHSSCPETPVILKTIAPDNVDASTFHALGESLKTCNCAKSPQSVYSNAVFRMGGLDESITSVLLPDKSESLVWKRAKRRHSLRKFLYAIVPPEKAPAPATVISERYLRGIHVCYDNALKQNALLRGRIAISITIDKKGGVKKSSIEGFNNEVDSCIDDQAKTWTFSPETDSEGNLIEKTYQIPIELKPQH